MKIFPCVIMFSFRVSYVLPSLRYLKRSTKCHATGITTEKEIVQREKE